MLDKDRIVKNFEDTLSKRSISQIALAKGLGMKPESLSRSKNRGEGDFFNLIKQQRIAEILGVSIEELVLPGLTEAQKYFNQSVDQSGNRFDRSNASQLGISNDPRINPYYKNSDSELQNKYNECMQKVISLTEEKSSLKDEINNLKLELMKCKEDK